MLAEECGTWADVVLSSKDEPDRPVPTGARHTHLTPTDVDSAIALLDDIAARSGSLGLVVVNSADRPTRSDLDVAQLEHDVLGSLALIEVAAERMAALGGGVVHLRRDLAPGDAAAAAIGGATPDHVAQLRPVRTNTIEIDGELLDALGGSGSADAGEVAAIVNGYAETLASVGDICRFLHDAPRVTGTIIAVGRPEFFYERN
jgi:hypothetical protein